MKVLEYDKDFGKVKPRDDVEFNYTTGRLKGKKLMIHAALADKMKAHSKGYITGETPPKLTEDKPAAIAPGSKEGEMEL